jgi:hypothetical protein
VNNRKRIFLSGILAAFVLGGVVLSLSRLSIHAVTVASLDVPGSITDLPANPGVVYESTLPASAQHVTARQSINAAEAEFQLTDAQIDPRARAVPVVVSVGDSLAEQHMHAWVVTADVDMQNAGGPGTPHFVTHKFCIVVASTTGKYIMGYQCGPRTPTS